MPKVIKRNPPTAFEYKANPSARQVSNSSGNFSMTGLIPFGLVLGSLTCRLHIPYWSMRISRPVIC